MSLQGTFLSHATHSLLQTHANPIGILHIWKDSLLFMCMLNACMYVSVPHVCNAAGGQKKNLDPWSYRGLWASMWLLRPELVSSVRASRVPNYWATSPALSFIVFREQYFMFQWMSCVATVILNQSESFSYYVSYFLCPIYLIRWGRGSHNFSH